MCGISVAITPAIEKPCSTDLMQLLENRGPDSRGSHEVDVSEISPHQHISSSDRKLHLSFTCTVLSLRGQRIVSQPLIDGATGSVLCWNGEAWKFNGSLISTNDSLAIFQKLTVVSSAHSLATSNTVATQIGIKSALGSVAGPYAFVYFDAPSRRIYFGRDCLGRRSLLKRMPSTSRVHISSISDPSIVTGWTEVEAGGLHIIDLFPSSQRDPVVTCLPYVQADEVTDLDEQLILPFPRLNKTCPIEIPPPPYDLSQTSSRILKALRNALSLRVTQVRKAYNNSDRVSQVGILFSGGLDCSILARIIHDLLPHDESIDLLNVAFENPRVLRAQASPDSQSACSPYEQCPDRITGRSTFAELQEVCSERQWRFVEINVPYNEALDHRGKIVHLMRPHDTEMDLSISYALYFASRGIGKASTDKYLHYETSARVLLSGLGADEIFGGYQRHATSFARNGYIGLLDELELDTNRLGRRNLGRDDRVISNWGREVRFPYLDEDFLALALSLPVWEKCGFGQSLQSESGEALDPCKSALRMIAAELGMRKVANEKKRAIQFGARTAKMVSGRTKGTETLRLA